MITIRIKSGVIDYDKMTLIMITIVVTRSTERICKP